MKAVHMVLCVVVLPMLVLAAYQFYVVDYTFDLIEHARSFIFVESAQELKYASDTQSLTGILNSVLFELHVESEQDEDVATSLVLKRYREIQLLRFYSFQKLKETAGKNSLSAFDFLAVLDMGKKDEINAIEREIQALDVLNEKIITRLIRDDSAEDPEIISEELRQSNAHTNELIGMLGTFTNKRYIQIEQTSRLVAESELRTKTTLNMVILLGYLLAGMLVLFFYVLVLRPVENFARAIELHSMEKVEWNAFESYRTDEIGIIYTALNTWLRLKLEKKNGSRSSRARKKKK